MAEKCGDLNCLTCYPLTTRTGKVITQDDLDVWAAEAEAGYDLESDSP